MSRLRLIVAVVIAASALSLGVGSASCIGPEVTLDPELAQPGDTIVVSGNGWGADCEDTNGEEGGCSWGEDDARPTQNIDIDIKRLGRPGAKWQPLVDDVDANDHFAFRVEITVPELPAGAYSLRVDGVRPQRLFIPPSKP